MTESLRLLLLFGHLLLCIFALQRVLQTDVRVLRGLAGAEEMRRTHALLVRLLAGLWISGVALAAIDLNLQFTTIGDKPKLIVKLLTVMVLTANALVLRYRCFEYLATGRTLCSGTGLMVLAAGALSTASWLAAAFFGMARPLQAWPLSVSLGLYAVLIAAALLGAAALALAAPRVRVLRRAFPALRSRPARGAQTSALHADVLMQHLRRRPQRGRVAVPHHATLLDDVVPVGQPQQRSDVLVDDHKRQSLGLQPL